MPDAAETAPAGRVPRTAKGRARAALLRRTAAALFVRNGYDATTMTAIAAEAGVSIGSLYQYYPLKEHLAAALESEAEAALLAAIDAARTPACAPPVLADRIFTALLAHAAAHPAHAALAARRDAPPEAARAAADRLRARIAEALARAWPPLPASRAMISAIVLAALAGAAAPAASGAAAGLLESEIRRMIALYLADEG